MTRDENPPRPLGRYENERLGRAGELVRELRRTREGRERAEAARQRSRRPRAEVYVNEFNGTVSWRLRDAPARRRRDGERPRSGETPYRTVSPAARAAALRSAGLDPAHGDRGAAPIPVHPAAVTVATHAPVDRMTPGELGAHLDRVSALRSRLSGDLARSGRMPVTAAARLRSGVDQARIYSLAREGTATSRERTTRHQRPAHLQPHRLPAPPSHGRSR